MTDLERRMLAWDMFFAGVAGIQYHPGNPPDQRMSLSDLADLVDLMLIEREKRWLSGLQQ
jgi:hypothetical protein